MVDDSQNKESMKGAIETLEQITSSNSTPKTIKKSITDLITELNNLIDNELKIKKLRENSIKWITENCEIGVLSKLEFEDYSLVLK